MTPVMSFDMRGKQEMGLKLSTAFPLRWSFKHRIVRPKVSYFGSSSSLFNMLFNCSAILHQVLPVFSTKSLAHRPCQELSNLATFYTDWLPSCYSTIRHSYYAFNLPIQLSLQNFLLSSASEITFSFLAAPFNSW